MDLNRKLTTEEAAAYLRLQPGTLEVWRCRGRGPKYHKIGRRVIYDLQDVQDFASSHTVLTVDSCPDSVRNRRIIPLAYPRSNSTAGHG